MNSIKISENRCIGENFTPYVIAEAGINHNGDFEIAKQLVYHAARSGADAIKFQKRTIDDMYTKEFLNREYLKDYSFGKTYGEHKKFLELSDEQFFELQAMAKSFNIDFLVSGFEFASFEFIEKQLHVPMHKIPSPFINHFPLLKQVAQYGKPIVLSTGMHSLDEIKPAVDFIRQYNDKIVVMQTTTLYPCQNEDANLKVLLTLKKELNTLVGYSSHDKGVVLPAAAVAYGACIIEKHFTLDRTMIGPDHIASVEPRGLELICKYAKTVFQGLGSPDKTILEAEKPQKLKYGVSIVSKNKIVKGQVLQREDITVKCPGGGISPRYFDSIIGKVAQKDIPEDSIIYEEDINLTYS